MSVRVKMKTLILLTKMAIFISVMYEPLGLLDFIIKAINGLKFILFIKVQVNLLHKQMQALNCLKMIIGLVLNVNLL